MLRVVNALARPQDFLVDLDAYLPAFPKATKEEDGRIRFLRNSCRSSYAGRNRPTARADGVHGPRPLCHPF